MTSSFSTRSFVFFAVAEIVNVDFFSTSFCELTTQFTATTIHYRVGNRYVEVHVWYGGMARFNVHVLLYIVHFVLSCTCISRYLRFTEKSWKFILILEKQVKFREFKR